MSRDHFVCNKRNDKGGDVALYVRNDVTYHRWNDLRNSDKSAESVFIEISQLKNSKLIIGCVYIPPGHDIRTFDDKVELVIQASLVVSLVVGLVVSLVVA